MKNFNLLLLIAFCHTIFGQSPYYKNGITFKKLFVDYQSQNGGSISAFKDYGHGFEIGYLRKVSKNLNLYLPVKIGNAADYNETTQRYDDCYTKQFAGLDAQVQYHFYNKTNKIVPYALAGAGAVYEFDGDNTNIQIPAGVGVNFKAANNAYINLQSEFRYSLAENRNNLHHGLGFTYLFGKTGDMPDDTKEVDKKLDKDMDGVEDKVDLCPEIVGLADLQGCPDADNDGVADYLDACKDIAGDKQHNGCPDSDKDGVSDNLDDCPTLFGLASNKGCPGIADVDNDGVTDSEDKCKDIPGVKENNGCPMADRDKDGVADLKDKCPDIFGTVDGCPEVKNSSSDKDNDGIPDATDKCPNSPGLKIYNGCPDTDGDGLDDSRDKCPNTFGTVAMNGCPEIAMEDKRTLDIAMRAVQFETGKATLKAESFTILNQIASIMSRYPDYNISITGHTDSQGDDAANLELSEKRAKACFEYLITEGVDVDRLKYNGLGENKPISTNDTPNGRALNRRVEFNLVPR